LEKILYENKIGMDTRIHETIVREYQVLPKRTHPMMNNKGYSGYVLTSIKIFNEENKVNN
jgi:tRNA A58 N-methylase Trm61